MGIVAVGPAVLTSVSKLARRPCDGLLVKALSVQGGETDVKGEVTAFARVVMSGVAFEHLNTGSAAPRRQDAVVLELSGVEELVGGLGEILGLLARATPTRMEPAMGLWSWRSEPLLEEDLLVAQANVTAAAIRVGNQVTPTVRVDFTGIPVLGLESAVPPVHAQGYVFNGPRQVQVLMSSLKKVVRSALNQRRADVYVPAEPCLSVYQG